MMNLIVELLLRSVSHSFGALALFAPSKLAALVLGAVATTRYWQIEVVGAVWGGSTLPMLFYVLPHPALHSAAMLLHAYIPLPARSTPR